MPNFRLAIIQLFIGWTVPCLAVGAAGMWSAHSLGLSTVPVAATVSGSSLASVS